VKTLNSNTTTAVDIIETRVKRLEVALAARIPRKLDRQRSKRRDTEKL